MFSRRTAGAGTQFVRNVVLALFVRIPGKSRAFWSKTIHCRDCGKPRPWFMAATKSRCLPCQRIKNREKQARFRAKNSVSKRNTLPLAERRCRDNYYKIRARSPKNIPKWVTIESLLPIYEYAERLDDENPGYKHVVSHKFRLKGKRVCGLHTLKNLVIIRKRMGMGSSPTDPT
jgi:hypothetical protein